MTGRFSKHAILVILFLFFLCFFGTLISARASFAGQLHASGCSVSTFGYLTDLAREYERVTGVGILVRGGGSVQGIEDLRRGTVDFAASCRLPRGDDPKDVEFIQVAWDALVFIAHPANPVDGITVEQARDINLGTITNWKALGGMDTPIRHFISKPRTGLSGLETSTKDLLLGGKEIVETRWSVLLASTGIVEQMVEKTPAGFAESGYSSAMKRKVKLLKVGGVAPSQSSIASGRYPFRRPLFILAPVRRKPEVEQFLRFVLGPEGQRFISSIGVVSLRDVK